MSEISKNKNFYSNINSSHINKSDHVTMETRKTNDGWQFVNEHCDNDTLLRRDVVKKTYPGNSIYAEVTERGKKVCLLGDSIIRRIDILEFDKCMDDGNAIKRCFPGCSSKEMKYYVKEVLEEAHPNTMIIHVGTNDMTKSQSSEKGIAQNVIKIVNTCRNKGVNKIIVSALTIRPKFSAKIGAINKLLST